MLQGDEVGDDPWMEFDWFKLLRKRVFQWKGATWVLYEGTFPNLFIVLSPVQRVYLGDSHALELVGVQIGLLWTPWST